MKNLKQAFLLLTLLSVQICAFAQSQPPAPAAVEYGMPPNTDVINTLAKSAWYRGGNYGPLNTATPQGPHNKFGTFWNSPVYHYTNGVFRMVLNGDNYVPDPANTSTNIDTYGFLGIGTKTPYAPIHLGEDLPTGGQGGGYRKWMTQGMLTLYDTDQIYVGLKDEGGDRKDAIINWGDNNWGTSADNLRFIFTTSPALTGTVGSGVNGVEVMHLNSSNQNVGIGPTFTNFRVPNRRLEVYDEAAATGTNAQMRLTANNPGNNNANSGTAADFQVSSNGDLYIRPFSYLSGINPNRFVGIGLGPNNPATEVLDVLGNARFRNMPAQGGQSLILGLQSGSSSDDVELSRLEFPGNANEVLLGDGTWGPAQGGNGFDACSNPTPAGILGGNSYVNLNNNQLYFSNNDLLDLNHTGFGYDCGAELPAKVSVYQAHPAQVDKSTTAISGINNDIANAPDKIFTGVYGQARAPQNNVFRPTLIGGDFSAANGDINMGVRARILTTSQAGETNYGFYGEVDDNDASINFGAFLKSENSPLNIGVTGIAENAAPNPGELGFGGSFAASGHVNQNIGVLGVNNSGTTAGQQNFGVAGIASGGVENYGVYGEVQNPGATNWAGYFVGPILTTGPSVGISDRRMKQNINPIAEETDALLMSLKPYSYEYRQEGEAARLNLPEGIQYGVIAQELEEVFPNMVHNVVHPAQYDSTGNIIAEKIQLKGVELTQLIPLMLSNLQKKNEVIQAQELEIADLKQAQTSSQEKLDELNARLSQLESCLSNILPELCEINHSNVKPAEGIGEENAQIQISLADKIVLNQNAPNPFAESTVISYNIPATVEKAQLQFTDATGEVIKIQEISQRGKGEIQVYGDDLSSGLYTYSLIVNGKVLATKKMVKM